MRADGFYWVFYGQDWVVAEFANGMWWLAGMDMPIDEADFVVDERRIEPPARLNDPTEPPPN